MSEIGRVGKAVISGASSAAHSVGSAAAEVIKSKKLGNETDTVKNESKGQSAEQTEIKPKDGKDITSKGNAKGHISIIDDGFNIRHPHPICVTPIDPIEKKIKEAIEKMIKEPRKAVEDIRSSKGPDRDNALLGFQQKIDKMSEFQLKEMRDYLVKEMSSPDNKDDELLGSLLNRVNNEIDSRDKGHIMFEDFKALEKINDISSGGGRVGKVGKGVSESIESVGQKIAQAGAKAINKSINKLED
jgi:hypothetical protein